MLFHLVHRCGHKRKVCVCATNAHAQKCIGFHRRVWGECRISCLCRTRSSVILADIAMVSRCFVFPSFGRFPFACAHTSLTPSSVRVFAEFLQQLRYFASNLQIFRLQPLSKSGGGGGGAGGESKRDADKGAIVQSRRVKVHFHCAASERRGLFFLLNVFKCCCRHSLAENGFCLPSPHTGSDVI